MAATNHHNISRRNALVGIGLAGAAAIVPVAGATFAKAAQNDRTAWDAAMRDLERQRAKAEAITARLDVVSDAFQKAKAKIPHVVVGESPSGKMGTGSEMQVSIARQMLKLGPVPRDGKPYNEYHALCLKLVEADEARKVEIEALDKRLGFTAANDAHSAAWERFTQLERVLLDMPAPDGEALMWKVQNLYEPGDGIWGEGVEDQTHADLRRFLLNRGA